MKMRLSRNRLTIKGLDGDEKYFMDTGKDLNGKIWTQVPSAIDGTIGIRPPENNYYYKSVHLKRRIVLHATHGVFTNDLSNLSKHHVSTAYLISRGGMVYELFDPKYWSYHIGKTPPGVWWKNRTESQQTIAIELSNIGDLRPHKTKSDILLDAWKFPYCMKSDTDFYVKCPTYRGHQYFAAYTNEQYKALDSLLLRLCRKFDIPHSFLPKDERLQLCNSEPKAGIVAHINYRHDKLDVSPAFLWEKISGR